MRKLLTILFIFLSFASFGQIPISALPTYPTTTAHGYIPIVIGGSTYKIDISSFGAGYVFDTTTLNLIARFGLKLNVTDTALLNISARLGNYQPAGNYKLNTDSTNIISGYTTTWRNGLNLLSSVAATTYQPLENQRLSTSNNVTFQRVISNTYIQSKANASGNAYNFVGYNYLGTIPIVSLGQDGSNGGYLGLNNSSNATTIYANADSGTIASTNYTVNGGNIIPSTSNTGNIGTDSYPFALVEANVIKKNGGTSSQYLMADGSVTTGGSATSGVYTPGATGLVNTSSVTTLQCQYIQVGNVVNVSGEVDCSVTTGGTYVSISFSLPVNTNYTNSNTTAGTCSDINNQASGTIYSGGSNIGTMRFIPPTNGTYHMMFNLTYLIQ